MQVQYKMLEEEQNRMVSQLMSAHAEEVVRLKAENIDLRARLELAMQGLAACGAPAGVQEDVRCDASHSKENAGIFPGWNTVLTSDVVRVQAIAEDGALTVGIHLAVLQRSPYFEARLASRWSEAMMDSVLPLRLPSGCPVSAALLLFQLLYSEDVHCLGVAGIALQDAAVVIAVAQLAGMLLLDDLCSELSHLACGLVRSTEEAIELQRRFVTLPSAVSAICRGADEVPAVAMAAPDLARMLQGTARSRAARSKAEAVLAAHGRTAACVKAVQVALEAMPFKISSPYGSPHVMHIDGEAFTWLWGLVQDYLLVPGSGTSLLGFFRSVASMRETFDESVNPLRVAFGKYLSHLASTRNDELSEAFRLGVVPEVCLAPSNRPHSCRVSYPNVLHFGQWSQELLPKLLRAAGPKQAALQSDLMELHPKDLAGLVDDSLLEAFGRDMALVCKRIAEDPSVLMQWVTRQRLISVPLIARRDLCANLIPSLGALPRDIASVVVQVVAGSAAKELHSASYRLTTKKSLLAMATVWIAVLFAFALHVLGFIVFDNIL